MLVTGITTNRIGPEGTTIAPVTLRRQIPESGIAGFLLRSLKLAYKALQSSDLS